MAQSIYDESVDYEDGTPNNASQIAKDVSEFLHWASYPEMDERKVMGIKTMLVTSALLGLSIYWKRFKWSYLKSRQVVYKPQKVNFCFNPDQKLLEGFVLNLNKQDSNHELQTVTDRVIYSLM